MRDNLIYKKAKEFMKKYPKTVAFRIKQHAKVASDIHNKDIKDVTKEERSAAKSVIFGIVYGISGFGLGENLHISKNDADKFIKKYYELYPEVKTYMDSEINFARENGFIETKYGRKR